MCKRPGHLLVLGRRVASLGAVVELWVQMTISNAFILTAGTEPGKVHRARLRRLVRSILTR
ncbi:hypothetical protein GCM10017559_02300 [Streptosporangium longisporum]|uniref:Uncharacterized protein n=1 Tax=Streptosporangium longisporum TaxID=46187 RepID=A0ABN3XQ16_9ACTN